MELYMFFLLKWVRIKKFHQGFANKDLNIVSLFEFLASCKFFFSIVQYLLLGLMDIIFRF